MGHQPIWCCLGLVAGGSCCPGRPSGGCCVKASGCRRPKLSCSPPYCHPMAERCPEAQIAALAAELRQLDSALSLLGAESPTELERLSRDYYEY